MVRLRLLYGLLTIIALLWGVGATSLMLMQDSTRRFDRRLNMDYKTIDAAQHFRTLTATLNALYLPDLAGPTPETPPSRGLFDRARRELEKTSAVIHEDSCRTEEWLRELENLDQALRRYYDGYETLLLSTTTTAQDRAALLKSIASDTQALADGAEKVMTMAEQRLFTGPSRVGEELPRNKIFVLGLVLLGTLIAAVIYVQILRHLVNPVALLHRSMEEIRKGNFELTLPSPALGSEFHKVIFAFNEMALELKASRGKSTETLNRANMVNRAIFHAIPSPVFIVGDDTALIQINPAAEQLSEKLGVNGVLPTKIQHILDECRKTQTHFLPEDPREALLFRIKEEEFYYLPRIFRFVSENASQSGWAILLHNVSRIRWLDDMKTHLLSTVSHEIKTPLTGIRMVLHLLLEERSSSLDDIQRMMVASANEDCERLLNTLNSLLDLSLAESGAPHLDRVAMSLEVSISRAAQLYASAAASKDISIKLDRDGGNFPDISADPVRLDEVVNNLVSNAIKHTPRGGQIILRLAQPDPEHLRVSVINDGPGVPEASQCRIFERFYRAPGQSSEGVGLGLFISREIIRAHEGRIGLRERADDLTEFYFDVPIT